MMHVAQLDDTARSDQNETEERVVATSRVSFGRFLDIGGRDSGREVIFFWQDSRFTKVGDCPLLCG